TAEVYVNDKQIIRHEGGFSTFRVDVTETLQKDRTNLIVVSADNSHQDNIYPQTADFTFSGGMYRDVKCIVVPETHFDLDCWGGKGVTVSSKIDGEHAWVSAETFITNPQETDQVVVTIYDESEQIVSESYLSANEKQTHSLFVQNAHLWQGIE